MSIIMYNLYNLSNISPVWADPTRDLTAPAAVRGGSKLHHYLFSYLFSSLSPPFLTLCIPICLFFFVYSTLSVSFFQSVIFRCCLCNCAKPSFPYPFLPRRVRLNEVLVLACAVGLWTSASFCIHSACTHSVSHLFWTLTD